jgi:hypothetical protein
MSQHVSDLIEKLYANPSLHDLVGFVYWFVTGGRFLG